MLSIRRYRTEDAPILWTLFYHTVRVINRRDYTELQVSAWAPSDFDLNSWQRTMDTIQPYIAEIEGQVVGYCDLQSDGLIDHFFCHHEYQGQGIGRDLMSFLFSQAKVQGIERLYSEVSITARPFYEKMGFTVKVQQRAEVRGETLTNFMMEKYISLKS
ncbi:GNAT family N-acetyltransferase [Vibrio diabolicus]|uniref:GNAT family N-acetyltransferase n=1 Tax=Vibrio diabolicus TaxID=50719 RepID=A0AAX1XIX2_9VIBR|nr:GNAT family N-acetyltransferase [Vibrio diabolicus]MCS0348405.1 GNAT family N-acetyltransferase [Vibrio diabolicus]MCS0362200.1 GNAT family N-acetyltransferase [Vibrio diabolicus]MCS0371960.1 GNAT family N-acetyltransferase [Vibrio diabolicus]MCS0427674.1 GNAT family N-acetyltransferase [Vibrio diabolicus]MCS0442965.1 GNAT family N-acetyltransferase [Vibrio diabolicus]